MDKQVLARASGYISVVEDSIGVDSADVVFAISSSRDIAPADGESIWKTLFSQLILVSSGYIWTCTKITFTDNRTEYSGKYCIGACSEFADVIELYALGGSNISAPTDGWQRSYTPSKGKWLWTKNELHFLNSSNVIYTDPICIGYFAKDGINGTSFNLRGIAKGHYGNFAAMKSDIGSLDTDDYCILDRSDDADSSADDAINKPSVVRYVNAPDYTWYIYEAGVGDAYRVGTDLWVATETKWVNMGSIQGPEGIPGKDALWVVVSNPQVIFVSDKDGLVRDGDYTTVSVSVFKGITRLNTSSYEFRKYTSTNFDMLSKATVTKNAQNVSIKIEASGIATRQINGIKISAPYSSITFEIAEQENYIAYVTIPIVVDTYKQDGYFHESINGLEAKYTNLSTDVADSKVTVTTLQGEMQVNANSIRLVNTKADEVYTYSQGIEKRVDILEASGFMTEASYAKMFSEYQKNGTVVSRAEVNTSIEDGIAKAQIKANQVLINADNTLAITGDYMTIDTTNFKLTKQGSITSTAGTIGGFEIADNRIGSAFNSEEAAYSSSSQMSLYNDMIAFNANKRQAIMGVTSILGSPFLMMLKDETLQALPKTGMAVAVKGSTEDNIAIEMGGGCISGQALKTQVFAYNYYTGSRPAMQTVKVEKSTNVLFVSTRCYWRAKSSDSWQVVNIDVNVQFPDMEDYDDGHVLMVKRGPDDAGAIYLVPGNGTSTDLNNLKTKYSNWLSCYNNQSFTSLSDNLFNLTYEGSAMIFVYFKGLQYRLNNLVYQGCWVQWNTSRAFNK